MQYECLICHAMFSLWRGTFDYLTCPCCCSRQLRNTESARGSSAWNDANATPAPRPVQTDGGS